jgi:hypothetical protein
MLGQSINHYKSLKKLSEIIFATAVPGMEKELQLNI